MLLLTIASAALATVRPSSPHEAAEELFRALWQEDLATVAALLPLDAVTIPPYVTSDAKEALAQASEMGLFDENAEPKSYLGWCHEPIQRDSNDAEELSEDIGAPVTFTEKVYLYFATEDGQTRLRFDDMLSIDSRWYPLSIRVGSSSADAGSFEQLLADDSDELTCGTAGEKTKRRFAETPQTYARGLQVACGLTPPKGKKPTAKWLRKELERTVENSYTRQYFEMVADAKIPRSGVPEAVRQDARRVGVSCDNAAIFEAFGVEGE